MLIQRKQILATLLLGTVAASSSSPAVIGKDKRREERRRLYAGSGTGGYFDLTPNSSSLSSSTTNTDKNSGIDNTNSDESNNNSRNNKCKQVERDTCCNQPTKRSIERQSIICKEMGCNLKKCSKRTDKEVNDEENDGDGWGTTATAPPTGSPSKSPTKSPVSWNGDAWGTTAPVPVPPTSSPSKSPTSWRGDEWGTTTSPTESSQWSGDEHEYDYIKEMASNDEGVKTWRVSGSISGGKRGSNVNDEEYNKCKQAERDTCCSQSKRRSLERQSFICDELGCNLKKCGKRNDNTITIGSDEKDGDEWGGTSPSPTRSPSKKPSYRPTKYPTKRPSWKPSASPSQSPTRKPSNHPTYRPSKSPTKEPVSPIEPWNGDGHFDGVTDNNPDTCAGIERQVCCTQPTGRSKEKKKEVCSLLGCNFKKCQKFD